jgi:pimeloyl-ACP methyl ester carboxylesterase/predicted glycosyltransferase
MWAEQPSARGSITRDGVRVAYEVYGATGPTLVLLPAWIIVHDRSWKAQIADFAQDCQVVVIDGRGNGLSGRPAGWENYTHSAYVDDALAVMDHLGVGDCALMGLSIGAPRAALLAQRRPDQVKAIVMIAPVGPLDAAQRDARRAAFMAPQDASKRWYNGAYMRESYEQFLRQFFETMFPEKHSTKQVEDGVAWGLETTAQCVIDSTLGALAGEADLEAAFAAVRCPTLVVHGDADQIVPITTGRRVAELTRAEMIEVAGSGHGPNLRVPGFFNGEVRRFLQEHGVLARKPAKPQRARRTPRALYLSSPIGLGHARRDLAVARALRDHSPDLAIDWLAQDPVTRFLAGAGETLHPISGRLVSESRHIEEEAGEHDLNVFQALRRMDEILVRNFSVFQEAVDATRYDLVIADEGWEVDHFWHEHPQLKRAPLVWMTDFVGFAPMGEGGAPEAALTADYNGEMVTHVESHPGVRDRAIFVGNPADVVDDALGPDLPGRRAWTAERFAFSGYILGDDVPATDRKAELRARFGFRDDEKVCVVTVGGSAVGASLIRRILAALPIAQRRDPGLRTIVVTGPRLNAEAFPQVAGVEFRGFEPALPQLLAAADLALVQGGLSTCMELVATRTPFIYFPLQRHFEQNIHVPQRLAAYGAGRRLAFADADPDRIAVAMDQELAAPRHWRDVERDGARRAAGLIAELL